MPRPDKDGVWPIDRSRKQIEALMGREMTTGERAIHEQAYSDGYRAAKEDGE